jgi:hypothetical protein
MGQIKVTTNMPSLIVKIFDGDNHCTEKSASSKPIPFFKDADDNGSHETNKYFGDYHTDFINQKGDYGTCYGLYNTKNIKFIDGPF